MNFDCLVVGAGLFGLTVAERLHAAGRRVLVLDRREHIGGNSYSSRDKETGIDVHRYGTHIFHTNDVGIWNYVHRFSEFVAYRHRHFSLARGRVYSFPVGLKSFCDYFGRWMSPVEMRSMIRDEVAAARLDPADESFEACAIRDVGTTMYRTLMAGYAEKQWGRPASAIPGSVYRRLRKLDGLDNEFFADTYQGVPAEGYDALVARMSQDIPVELKVDFLPDRDYWRRRANTIVFSGALDGYFDYMHGALSWRSVSFEAVRTEEDNAQGCAVLSFADSDVPWTRRHEPRHLNPARAHSSGSVLLYERSADDASDPAYPVNGAEDRERLEAYRRLAAADPRVRFGGRLAQYKYLDMHQAIGAGLKLARSLLG